MSPCCGCVCCSGAVDQVIKCPVLPSSPPQTAGGSCSLCQGMLLFPCPSRCTPRNLLPSVWETASALGIIGSSEPATACVCSWFPGQQYQGHPDPLESFSLGRQGSVSKSSVPVLASVEERCVPYSPDPDLHLTFSGLRCTCTPACHHPAL